MLVCVCERDDGSNGQNLRVIDTEKLKAIAANPDHADQELAQEWLNALTILYKAFKTDDRLWFTADYTNPSEYSPREAMVETFPATIDFCCDVWVA